MGFKLAVDAHFGGVESYTGSSALQQALDFCNRSADLVIVTNVGHADHVRRIGGQAFVCADPLPDLSAHRGNSVEVPRKVFFICSFDIDEPYHEVFRAAEMLWEEGFRFAVSGNYAKAGIAPETFPFINFLGFVPEDEFYSNLYSSEVVVDLTDHDNCLVCGAYEAIAAEKPLVLSKKRALENHFRDGAIFTENNAVAIASAVTLAYDDRVRLRANCVRWAAESRVEMSATIGALAVSLQNL
jgi:glycosyltransferase involved in cell wall biosynthesis